jgi:hypothetical protein
MLAASYCYICEVKTAERTLLVLQPGPRVEDWPLCAACWRLLERGIRQTMPEGSLETALNEFGGRLPESQLLALIAAGQQTDNDSPITVQAWLEQERRRLLRSRLRAIGARLTVALAASRGDDRTEVLKAIRVIEGRARLIRVELERDLEPAVPDTTLPPLVRAVQEVGGVIADHDVDRLLPNELRAKLHGVLHTLNRALQDFLQLADEIPFLESPEPGARQDRGSASA